MNVTISKKLCATTVLILLAGTLAGCGGAPTGQPNGGMEAPIQEEPAVISLAMAYPTYETIALTSEIIGTVSPQNQSEVLPKMSGEVLSVHFQAGDRVAEGQVLVTLDSDSLTSARINIDTAQLQLGDYQKTLERTQALYDSGATSQQELEQAQKAVTSAQLQLESAQDSYNTLQKNVNITAPISGIIESRSVEVHDNVSPQGAICVIAQKDTMQVVFQVSERIKNTLRPGDAIALSKNGSDYTGKVTEIASKTSSNSGLFEIKADIQDGASLSSGSKVAISLITDRAENALTIPVDAIYYDNGSPYVFINNGGIAEIRYIETGINNSQLIQVTGGLDESTQVITSWSSKLTNGTAVEAINDTQAVHEEVTTDESH